MDYSSVQRLAAGMTNKATFQRLLPLDEVCNIHETGCCLQLLAINNAMPYVVQLVIKQCSV